MIRERAGERLESECQLAKAIQTIAREWDIRESIGSEPATCHRTMISPKRQDAKTGVFALAHSQFMLLNMKDAECDVAIIP